MNKEKHDLGTYMKLSEASIYFLNYSFFNLDNALKTDYTGELFSKKIDLIETTEEDNRLLSSFSFPTDTIEFLQQEIKAPLSQGTSDRLKNAWLEAENELVNSPFKFSKTHSITSIDVIGHVTNFAFFIETITNRHLLFLNQSGELENFSYNQITQAKILNRLIYIFKDEIQNNQLNLNEIANLFSLRNKTVHYTPDNAISLRTDLSTLMRIWNQSITLCDKFYLKEQFLENKFSYQIQERIDWLLDKWIE